MIEPEVLKELLRCDPETGKLYWRYRDIKWFKSAEGGYSPERRSKRWNSRYADIEAFTFSNEFGYKRGSVLGSLYMAHRVVWAMCKGVWPKDQIDHIDHNPENNRLENLREVSNLENSKKPVQTDK